MTFELSLLHSPLLQQIPNLRHAFTTRKGGVSQDNFAELNLKYPTLPTDEVGGEERVLNNRQALSDLLGFNLEQWVACQQVHGKHVYQATAQDAGRGAFSQTEGIPDCDGLVTNTPGLCLMVMVADCYPLILVDPIHKVVATLHSGWRGTQQGIALEALRLMQMAYGSEPQAIIAAIGPGIGFDSFEVGAEVVEAFAEQIDRQDPRLVKAVGQKYRLNLPEILKDQLLAGGLPEAQIDLVTQDTFSDLRFFSYRREQGLTGRQAALVGWAA